MGQYSSLCKGAAVISLDALDMGDGQSACKVWKRRSKRRRETREGHTRRDRQRTDDQTHIVDGMRME